MTAAKALGLTRWTLHHRMQPVRYRRRTNIRVAVVLLLALSMTQRMRALVVDEDPLAAAQVRGVLQRAGLSVSVATSFSAARAMACEHPPDLSSACNAKLDVGADVRVSVL